MRFERRRFLILRRTSIERIGAYVNCWVEASDAGDAEARVRALIESEIRDRISAGAVLASSSWTIAIDMIEPVSSPPDGPIGWALFRDDDSSAE